MANVWAGSLVGRSDVVVTEDSPKGSDEWY